jgi:hypothetical protein
VSKLVNIFQLSELTGVPVRSWRTLIQKRAVPYIKTGHRSIWFDVEKVEQALAKFEIREVGAK